MIRFRNSLAMLVALFALAFTFSFVSPSETSAQFNRCAVSGTVVDFNTAAPINGVDVWTFDVNTNVAQHVDTTDVYGYYSFSIGGGTQVLVYLPTTPKWTFYSTNGSGTYRSVTCGTQYNQFIGGIDFYGHLN